jgi:alpha-1,6-mannosyltransferase
MKICDLAQFYSPLGGGVKRYISDKQRHLEKEAGWEHVLIIPSFRDAVKSSPVGRLYEVKSPRLVGSRSYRILMNRKKILRIIQDERPDLIEVGDPYRTAWIGLEAARSINVPVIAFYHSDFPRAFGRTIERFLGRPIERLISHWIDRYVVRLYNRMNATVVATRRLCDALTFCGIKRVINIPLGTDVSTFKPKPSRGRIRGELGLDANQRLLLFVGRIAREKGIRQLVDTLDHLPDRLKNCHLLLVGDGELGEWVRRQVDRRSDLTWLPYSESSFRLAEIYSAADLFIHPGKWETFGIVSLEAQACGCRVIGIAGGGLEESLHGEQPLILAREATGPAIAEAIVRALDLGETDIERVKRSARMVEQFSIETTFVQLTALYRHLIAGHSAETYKVPTRKIHGVQDPALQT